MSPSFRSLLYTEPRLYDLIYPDAAGGAVQLCRKAWHRHGAGAPASVLDVGCGSGRFLEQLGDWIAERWGVELLESNVAHARSVLPDVRVVQADMCSVRLDRTFDLVTSFGNALSYALTDAALAAAFETLAAHARPGALTVLDVLNARSYLEGDEVRDRLEGQVDVSGFRATWASLQTLDRAARTLRRTRRWTIEGRDEVEDFAEYRLLFPEELVRLLEAAGFEVLVVSDNRDLRPTDLSGGRGGPADASGMRGRKLYAVGRRRGTPPFQGALTA